MQIGIVSSAYLRRYGVKEGAIKMKAHGYDAIDFQDLVDTETEFFKKAENEFEMALKEQKNIVEGEGLFFSQAHGPWRWPIKDYEIADREERLESMKKGVRGTSYLNSKNFVIHPIMPFGLNCLEKAKEMREINAEFFYKLCRHAKDFGVDVCLENMPFLGLPISSVESIVSFVKEMGLSNFKVCLDVGHDLIWGNQPAKSVELIGDLLSCIHAHDNDGANDYHQNPKIGVCDWESFAKSLQKSAYTGVFSLETSAKASENAIETEREELKLIKTVKDIIKE